MNNKLTKNLIIPGVIIVAAVLVGGAIVYAKISKCPEESPESGQVLPSQEVAEKVIGYINENILRGRATASLINVLEENELYKIKFAIQGNEFDTYVTRNGELFFPEVVNLKDAQPAAIAKGFTIGDFSVSEDDVCKEEGKPIIYFFGSQGCPHCSWEQPIIEGVADKFKENIVFYNNGGTAENMDVFQKYSTGGVPTLVLGCKYYREGSGENVGQETEIQNLTALICKLTDNQPSDVCNEVQDLIDQIQ